MVKIRQAIVVEGRYDKNTLSQIIDAPIFQTNGFQILKDKTQLELLRRVAQSRGLVVFTDSDGAGFVIRNFLKSAIEAQYLLHAYIPDVYGKEKRKASPGKEGKLGVEGMSPQIILDCLRRAGATFAEETVVTNNQQLTKTDLFFMGLSGGPDSSLKRKRLQKALDLPEHLSCNALLEVLNLLYSKEEVYRLVDTL